jgi:hypothetical protein
MRFVGDGRTNAAADDADADNDSDDACEVARLINIVMTTCTCK